MRKQVRLSALLISAISLATVPAATTLVVADTPLPAAAIPLGVSQLAQSLVAPLSQSLAPATSAPLRVALVSSGVDAGALPKSLGGQLSFYGSGGDPVGYGTYAASEILQLAPRAAITSIGVYPNGKFDAAWQNGALSWVTQNVSKFDVVLCALPPSELLDPISAEMAAGTWNDVADAIADSPLAGSGGPVLGAPLSGGLRGEQARSTDGASARLIGGFSDLVTAWDAARADIQKIDAAGVAVVSPAGDLGPNPQTVFGLANLPEVVAVGGYDGSSVSATSSAGPSIDGHVKPDLIAPTSLVGLMPAASALAKDLKARGLLDPSLEPTWSAGEAPTKARSRLDSTVTSATVVAVAMAGMNAGGVHDVSLQRGALTAASVPLRGVPVWRQGGGLLRVLPDAAFARGHTLFRGHLDLGQEPASGAWTAAVDTAQGSAQSAATHLTDWMGVGADARPTLAGDGATPPVTASVGNRGVTVTVAPGVLGSDSYQGGVFCGYTDVALPGSSQSADPGVDAHGIPDGTEQLPTCLVKGSRLTAHSFFIHALDAESETWSLLPSLPPGAGLLDRPLSMLPIDPLDVRIYTQVTDRGGNAHFPNIVPGYYHIKEFSDYGSPLTQTVTDVRTGRAVTQATDIGENPGYQAMDALVLTPACPDQIPSASQDTPDVCSENTLDAAFGASNVRYDRFTQTYVVTAGPISFNVVFDHFKKVIGVGVSSRYIDLLTPGDFRFVSSSLGDATKLGVLDRLPGTQVPVWSFAPAASPSPANPTGAGSECMQATLNPLAVVGQNQWGTVGVASMPFNMTTPNYKMHMSLNFSYDLTNALVIPVVQVGDELSVGVVSSTGDLSLQDLTGGRLPDLRTVQARGHSQGVANFEFHHKPRGLSQGTLYLVFVPPADFSSRNLDPSPITAATVCDASFELDTWTNALWPATHFPLPNTGIDLSFPNTSDQAGTYGGHAFSVQPNWSAAQMNHPACRLVGNGEVESRVCQDWEVFVHAPKANAAVFDVLGDSRVTALPGLRLAGGRFVDPRRGVQSFSTGLAFKAPTLAALQAGLDASEEFLTNGRFWEDMVLPMSFNATHARGITVQIQDLRPEEPGGVLPRSLAGGADVAPYVPFIAHDAFVETPLSNP
jgi:hypothetical protein